MAVKINHLSRVDSKTFVVEVSHDPLTDTAISVGSYLDAMFPPAAGYTKVQSVMEDLVALPNIAIKWWKSMMKYFQGVYVRNNADGTVSNIYTYSEP